MPSVRLDFAGGTPPRLELNGRPDEPILDFSIFEIEQPHLQLLLEGGLDPSVGRHALHDHPVCLLLPPESLQIPGWSGLRLCVFKEVGVLESL